MVKLTAQLDRTFAALSDPTRRAILTRLAKGEATVSELSAPFDLSQPAISKHLRVLEDAGLIERGREGQTRPRRLVSSAIKDAGAWMEPFLEEWNARFNNLERHLVTTKRKK